MKKILMLVIASLVLTSCFPVVKRYQVDYEVVVSYIDLKETDTLSGSFLIEESIDVKRASIDIVSKGRPTPCLVLHAGYHDFILATNVRTFKTLSINIYKINTDATND